MTANELLDMIFHDEDSLLLAKGVRQFCEQELLPLLEEVRKSGEETFPTQFIRLMGEREFLGTSIPAEYGGQGGNLELFLPILEGIAAFDGSLALTVAAHESLASTHILLGGSEEQRKAYLPDLASGRKLAAWCLTEPGAGTNILGGMKAGLNKSNGNWTLSGEKTFITNGCHANVYVVAARSAPLNGRGGGITACVVERNEHSSRIQLQPLHGKMGMRITDTASVNFDDVPVGESSFLRGIGEARETIVSVLLRARIGISALGLGLARDSFLHARAHTKDRIISKEPLFNKELTQVKLVGMLTKLWVAWQGIFRAARLAVAGEPFKAQACMAKLFATEAALEICDESIQLLGGYGYMQDHKVEQNYRDARLLTIGEGTSEIQQFTIARVLKEGPSTFAEICGEPPSFLKEKNSAPFHAAAEVLEIARNSFESVLKYARTRKLAGGVPLEHQPTQVKLADILTRLWVARLAVTSAQESAGSSSSLETRMARLSAFEAAREVCHEAIQLLGDYGDSDKTLVTNYTDVLAATPSEEAAGEILPAIAESL